MDENTLSQYFPKYYILLMKKTRWLMDERQCNESILENCIFYELSIKTSADQIILKP